MAGMLGDIDLNPISADAPFTAIPKWAYFRERVEFEAMLASARQRLGGTLDGVEAYLLPVFDPAQGAAVRTEGFRITLWAKRLGETVGVCAFDKALLPIRLLVSLRSALDDAGLSETVAWVVLDQPMAAESCKDCAAPLFFSPDGRSGHDDGGPAHVVH